MPLETGREMAHGGFKQRWIWLSLLVGAATWLLPPLAVVYGWLATIVALLLYYLVGGLCLMMGIHLGGDSDPRTAFLFVGTIVLYVVLFLPLNWVLNGYLLHRYLRRRSERESHRAQSAQPSASPNGGPAMPSGNSQVTEGPPSVS
jgi:hypothetical protein